MMNRLQALFNAYAIRSKREKVLLLLMAVLLVIVIFYYGYQPTKDFLFSSKIQTPTPKTIPKQNETNSNATSVSAPPFASIDLSAKKAPKLQLKEGFSWGNYRVYQNQQADFLLSLAKSRGEQTFPKGEWAPFIEKLAKSKGVPLDISYDKKDGKYLIHFRNTELNIVLSLLGRYTNSGLYIISLSAEEKNATAILTDS